mmetsp:Transcript_1075/g.1378  ORF Transcript_1075/g.1378 Transcript_1075/m.1378 type:complete len:430 (-) Transcript_1075:37-1326(-)
MFALFVALLVVLCAILAAFGFKGRATIVGIDLGTTYSVIGVNENDVVRIIPDQRGNHLIPSMVSFLATGEIKIGIDSSKLKTDIPHVTIYEAKRIIGRSFETDLQISKESENRPFKLVRSPQKNDQSQAWYDISHLSNQPSYVSPRRIGSLVLGELLSIAKHNLGHSQIRSAVIAVPAKFDQNQKAETVNAFKDAGLTVQRILEEPTAAALAYGLHNRPDVNYVLVYDIGGGTLDVSLLFISEKNVQVIATDGDDELGGGDFDRKMMEVIFSKLGPRLLRENIAYEIPEKCGFKENICGVSSLKDTSVQAKHDLSLSEETIATCRYNKIDAQKWSESCADWTLAEIKISKGEFEDASSGLFLRALNSVDRLLESSGLSAEEIDEVVMVGGSSRIPKIREDLKKRLNVSQLNTSIDPDITVAYGVATVAH